MSFLVLWVWNVRDELNWQKTKFALTCSFQKMIQLLTLAIEGHKKLDDLFYFKILGIV